MKMSKDQGDYCYLSQYISSFDISLEAKISQMFCTPALKIHIFKFLYSSISVWYATANKFLFQHNREIVKMFIPSSLPTLIIKVPKLAALIGRSSTTESINTNAKMAAIYVKQHKETVVVTQHLGQPVNQNFYMSQPQIYIKHKQEINNNNGSSQQHEVLSPDVSISYK